MIGFLVGENKVQLARPPHPETGFMVRANFWCPNPRTAVGGLSLALKKQADVQENKFFLNLDWPSFPLHAGIRGD